MVMNKTELEGYRIILENAFEEIGKYLKSSEDSAAVVEPDKSLGRLSRMEAMQDQQLVLEMRRRKKRQLAEIKSALLRVEMNRYGNCIFCGHEISKERLDASPETQTCVKCS